MENEQESDCSSRNTLRLASPELRYLNSYLEACRESFHAVHNTYILHDPDRFPQWRDRIFQDYENQARGIGLPPGHLPSVTFWALAGERVVGVVNIRLGLNAALADYGGHAGCFIRCGDRGKGYAKRLLPMVIRKAGELGISPVLFTCVESNTASLRVLESLPCVRMERAVTRADGVLCAVRRFWFS